MQHLEVIDSQGVTLVRLLDRQLIDGVGIEDLGQELYRLITSEDQSKLVLDFSLVNFFTSAALGKLLALRRKVAAKNGTMKLCCMRPHIHEVFAITKLDGLFDIEDNATEALATFG